MKVKRVVELIANDENEHIYMRKDMQPTPSWYVLCTDTANWTLVKGKEADRLEDDWYADAAYEDAEVAYGKAKDELKEYIRRKPMSKLEELEKKVADTEAAYAAADEAHASYSYAWVAYTGPAAHAACIVLVHAEAAYVKAVDELKEYKEQDNE